jgi:hypothetical protein
MTLQDLLTQADQSGALDQIAAQLGIDKEVARRGMAQLAPAVARGMQRSAGGGIEDLVAMLGGSGQPGQADLAGAGDSILGQIFGSKDVSRNVAGHAATQTGLDSSLLRRMLPLVASAAVMLLSQRARQAGANPPPPGAAPNRQGGSALDALTSMLDQNQDGSAVDDLLNLARKFF